MSSVDVTHLEDRKKLMSRLKQHDLLFYHVGDMTEFKRYGFIVHLMNRRRPRLRPIIFQRIGIKDEDLGLTLTSCK